VFGEADVPAGNCQRRNTFNTIAGAELESMKKAAQPVDRRLGQGVTAKGANGKALLDSARSLIPEIQQVKHLELRGGPAFALGAAADLRPSILAGELCWDRGRC